MCRLLYINSKNNFQIADYLENFAEISKNSKEFQGHGWGIAYYQNNKWNYYKNVKPIWEDDLSAFGLSSRVLAHARSAFKDEGIVVENNMPFYDHKYIFIFNGELRGVRIKEDGRIGAEKIFNYIKRFDKGNIKIALSKATDIIIKKTSYIRAMNIILSSDQSTLVYSKFNEDDEYFTMHYLQSDDFIIVCSEQMDNITGWRKIPKNSLMEFKCI